MTDFFQRQNATKIGVTNYEAFEILDFLGGCLDLDTKVW